MARNLLLQLGVCALAVAHVAPAAAAPAQPKLVVVVDPQGDGPVQRQASAVEAALHEKLALVPLADYLRAAKAVGGRPKASYATEMAVAAGRAVGATHVLVFEPLTVRVPGRRRESTVVAATLVDTQTGENLVERRTGRESSRASQETVARLAAEIVTAATTAPTALAQVPAPAPEAERKAAAESERRPAADAERRAPAGKAAAGTSATPATAATPHGETATPAPVPAPLPDETPALAPLPVAPRPAAAAHVAAAAAESRAHQGPYGVHFQLGAMLYQRVAVLSEGGKAQLRYGGGPGLRSPLFARVNARLELQPIRFAGRPPRGYDGLLLFGDADLGWARTATTQGVRTGRNGTWQVGGGWRQPLWHAPSAVVLAAKVGYSRYSFVVPPGARFVSDGFAGLLTELAIEVPFGTPTVALVAQAGLISVVRGFGGTQHLGTRAKSALGGRAEAGFRFLVAGHLDFDVAFNWQRYRASFDGPSDLADLQRTYTGVSVSDQTLGGSVRVGMRF